MDNIEEIIRIINITVNKIFYDNKSIIFLLDNKSSLNCHYDIFSNNFTIIHNLDNLDLEKIINEIKNENNDLLINTKNIKNKIIIDFIKFKSHDITIIFSNKQILSNNIYYNNIYFDILILKYVLFDNNSLILLEDNLLTIDTSKIYVKSDIEFILEIISLYVNYDLEELYTIIIDFIDLLKKDNDFILKFKENLKNNGKEVYIKLINTFEYLESINKLINWIKLFDNEFSIFYNFFFNKDKINLFGIDYDKIKTMDLYLLIILLNIENVVNYKYLKYIYNINKNTNDLLSLIEINKLEEYKKIKSTFNSLPNFDILLAGLNYNTKYKIKVFYHIFSILFFHNSSVNIESIKIAYIFKRYYNFEKEFYDIFYLFNKIIINITIEIYDLNNILILDDSYFYILLKNYKMLIEFESSKLLHIPVIKKKFINKEDNIDIIDYQDSFGLVYEFIYCNKPNFDNINNDFLENLLNSILSNIRSNYLLPKNKINSNYDKDYEDNLQYYLCDKYSNDIDHNNQNNYDLNNFDNNNFDNNNYDYNLENDVANYLENSFFNLKPQLNDYDLENDEFIGNLNIFDNFNLDENNKIKSKYKKEKKKYYKLKNIEKIFSSNILDCNILLNFKEVNDELIDILINKYSSLITNDIIIDEFLEETSDSDTDYN